MGTLDDSFARALAAAAQADLATMNRRARKHGVKEVHIEESSSKYAGGGHLRVLFGDDTALQTGFGSFTILKDHVRKWRSAYEADLYVDGTRSGKVSMMNPALMREGEADARAARASTPRTRGPGVALDDHEKLWPWLTRMHLGPKFGTGIAIGPFQQEMGQTGDRLRAAAAKVVSSPKYVRAKGASIQVADTQGKWHDIPGWHSRR